MSIQQRQKRCFLFLKVDFIEGKRSVDQSHHCREALLSFAIKYQQVTNKIIWLGIYHNYVFSNQLRDQSGTKFRDPCHRRFSCSSVAVTLAPEARSALQFLLRSSSPPPYHPSPFSLSIFSLIPPFAAILTLANSDSYPTQCLFISI